MTIRHPELLPLRSENDEFLETLLDLPKLAEFAVSPDGSRVAWTWFASGPGSDVYAAPTSAFADIGDPTRLTNTGERTHLVSWTADSRAVLVAHDCGGDERVQLFRVDLDRPGVLQPLTEPSPPFFLRGGQLHPNGRWLVYAMNFDVGTNQEIEPTWVYRHDRITGERLPLARPKRAAYFEPRLNDTGTHVLYQREDLDPAGSQVWVVDIDGREDREILNFGAAVKVTGSWMPDSRSVLFVVDAETHRRLGIWRMGEDSNPATIRWLVNGPDSTASPRPLETASAPRGVEHPVVVMVETEDGCSRASLLDVETGTERAFPAVTGTLLPERPIGEDEWLGLQYSSTQPADIVRFGLDTPGSRAAVTDLESVTGMWRNTTLGAESLTPAEAFRWHSIDGLAIQGWLYRPKGEARGTIVWVHGGPTARAEDIFDAGTQFFVHAGFNVLLPNYRGSTGFGLPFQEAIKADGWGGREQDDIRTGIEALIAAGVAESGKVGITGGSYGGYSAWCAITRWPVDIVAASAPICGMTDLVVDYETTRPDLRGYSEEMMGGTPTQMPDRYRQHSPIHFVDRIRGRLLIIQGLRDPNVTPENVRAVEEALQAADIPYELLAFEDEGHGMRLRHNRATLYQRLVQFFAAAFDCSHAVVARS